MLRKLLFVSIALIMGLDVYAQDPQFTQNMFNRLFYNPAYAGSNSALCGTAIHRQQYTGFEGAPVTTVASIESNFNLPFLYMRNSGIGLTFVQDEIGNFQNTTLKIAYSHLIKPQFMPGFFRLGIDGGFMNTSLNGNFEARHPAIFDPAIVNTSDMTADFGFGAYYYQKQLYVGISATHITAPAFEKAEGNKDLYVDLDRHYYVTGGYYYEFNTPTPMELQPSFLVKSTVDVTQADINANFLYNKFVWGGLSYRVADNANAIGVLAGIDFTEQVPDLSGMKVGLAYDFGISDISKETGGSFEIMLNYCYKIIVPPKRQKYKSVIWL